MIDDLHDLKVGRVYSRGRLAVVDGRYRYAAEVTGRYENAKAAAAQKTP